MEDAEFALGVESYGEGTGREKEFFRRWVDYEDVAVNEAKGERG